MSPLIQVHDVSKRFNKEQQVLSNVSFNIKEGEIVGLLGPNGSGKTTLMKIMLGLLPPSAGTVTLFGKEFRQLEAPVEEVGVLLDPTWLNSRIGVKATIKYHASLVGNRRVFLHPMESLAEVGLDAAASKKVSNLSLGMRQRLALAVAMISQPKILILDEPINGLDPDGILQVREILRNFREKGGSILLSSHLMTEMQMVADRVVILKQGHVLADGTIESLGKQSEVEFSVLGDPADMLRALENEGIAVSKGAGVKFCAQAVDSAHVFRIAVAAGATLLSLETVTSSLEESYARLTA